MRVFIVLEVMVLLTIHALEQKISFVLLCSICFFYILFLLIIVFEGKQNTAEAGAREGGW